MKHQVHRLLRLICLLYSLSPIVVAADTLILKDTFDTADTNPSDPDAGLNINLATRLSGTLAATISGDTATNGYQHAQGLGSGVQLEPPTFPNASIAGNRLKFAGVNELIDNNRVSFRYDFGGDPMTNTNSLVGKKYAIEYLADYDPADPTPGDGTYTDVDFNDGLYFMLTSARTGQRFNAGAALTIGQKVDRNYYIFRNSGVNFLDTTFDSDGNSDPANEPASAADFGFATPYDGINLQTIRIEIDESAGMNTGLADIFVNGSPVISDLALTFMVPGGSIDPNSVNNRQIVFYLEDEGTRRNWANEAFIENLSITLLDGAGGTLGDFDDDGDVDGNDFLEWQRGNSPNGTPGGPVSAADLADWQSNYAFGGLAAVVGVPEPATGLLVIALASCLFLGLESRRNNNVGTRL